MKPHINVVSPPLFAAVLSGNRKVPSQQSAGGHAVQAGQFRQRLPGRQGLAYLCTAWEVSPGVSAGSACHRGKASHVLTAMGLDKRTAAGTVRISFGPETEFADIDALAEALLEHKNTRFPML